MPLEHISENIIVLIPTNDDNVMCWKKLCTPVELMALNRTNITKLIIVIEIKWISPPAMESTYLSD